MNSLFVEIMIGFSSTSRIISWWANYSNRISFSGSICKLYMQLWNGSFVSLFVAEATGCKDEILMGFFSLCNGNGRIQLLDEMFDIMPLQKFCLLEKS